VTASSSLLPFSLGSTGQWRALSRTQHSLSPTLESVEVHLDDYYKWSSEDKLALWHSLSNMPRLRQLTTYNVLEHRREQHLAHTCGGTCCSRDGTVDHLPLTALDNVCWPLEKVNLVDTLMPAIDIARIFNSSRAGIGEVVRVICKQRSSADSLQERGKSRRALRCIEPARAQLASSGDHYYGM